MIRAIMARLKQGHRTISYPKAPVPLPERFRGYPELAAGALAESRSTEPLCPFGAISSTDGVALDMGRCLFCPDCTADGCVRFSNDPRLAVTRREHLVVRPAGEHYQAQPLEPRLQALFRRSLKFREVSAGGCNACEADTNVLSTIGWDLGRFGIQFVASPRHADGLWVTGPVTVNMIEALRMTYDAIPEPKIVVACGACAINGGPFLDSPEVCNGVDGIIPVDLYIPGCPPHPVTILDGLLRLLDRVR